MGVEINFDWGASIAAGAAILAWIGSMVSAAGAAKAADVAGQAEKRIREGDRLAAEREVKRTAAQVEVEARMALQQLERAEALSKASATFFGGELRIQDAGARTPFSEWRARLGSLVSESKAAERVSALADSEVASLQISLDRVLIEVRAEREAATEEASLLDRGNQILAATIEADERAQGIFKRRDSKGRLV